MPLPLPQPGEIAERLAAGFEAGFAPMLAPGEVVDARSPTSPLAILGRVQSMAAFELHLALQRLAEELFPDTASADLARHAGVWGVPRRAAVPAAGNVTFTGVDGLVLPSGIALQLGITGAVTTAGGIIAGGTLTVPAVAAAAGAAGNVPAGTLLPLVAPIAGLTAQAATVAAGGLTDGLDEEAEEDWRGRVLARIRAGVPYGQAGGYARWALDVPGVAAAAERPGWLGLGSVGVVVAGGTARAPVVPGAALLASVQAALDANRPVTALAVAVPVTLQPVALQIRLAPDTAAVRAAVAEAFALFLAAEPGIGGTVARSRLSEALSSAAGEYSHRLDAPAADIALGPAVLAVPGAITWLPS